MFGSNKFKTLGSIIFSITYYFLMFALGSHQTGDIAKMPNLKSGTPTFWKFLRNVCVGAPS